MQMSIERFREVHKLIWNTVIEHVQEVREGRAEVMFLKRAGIDKACDEALIDEDEAILIKLNNGCLLYTSYSTCSRCVLDCCSRIDSTYQRAVLGDKDAMIKIRDIVDKKPFTELSIITLYD